MPEKPANQDLSEGQSAGAAAVNAQLEAAYEAAMDTMLLYVGRDVTFYLPPIKSAPVVNPEKYNPFTGGQDRRTSNSSAGSKGYELEPVWVTYKAHVKHGPAEIQDGEEGVPFTLDIGDVQLTTVYGSNDDINQAVEVQVDGIKFIRKKVDARPIGWSTPKYIISVWTKKAQG